MTTTSEALRADSETVAEAPAPVTAARRYRPGAVFTAAWALWVLDAVATLLVPDRLHAADPLAAGLVWTVAAVALTGWAGHAYRNRASALWLRHWAPWLTVVGLWVLVWEFTTAKSGWLRPPYFASPQHMLLIFYEDGGILASSTWHSLLLLLIGFGIGASAGLGTGIALGWSRLASYWGHPVLQTLGPVPPATLLPLVLVLFPTSYSGSVFMVAFGVWFPVSVLTRAGIAGVPRGYFDVAQTLGATPRFLIWRVAVPGALPSIFTGLFMGLGASLGALAVAELLGVKNGLGWYIQWTKGWAAYPRMYAAIAIMIVVCRTLMVILFRIRNRVLAWEKDLVRW
ncbi:ABC transporter permease [Nocardia sp. alder85J]|uniref:ABC transporter permease n=1 Tax=Nocardia sp. alder85J TaxID=2862949 RepID=UPI001CD1BD20|nr:ABC transporter permease subunit [Nocardia sp. alder85J]MCX4098283.1 ABC transporter permease subunit [Nocardia sp. alder85J]